MDACPKHQMTSVSSSSRWIEHVGPRESFRIVIDRVRIDDQAGAGWDLTVAKWNDMRRETFEAQLRIAGP